MSEMKLSEAMRIGSTKRPQSFCLFFEHLPVAGVFTLCSCAIGAAYEGMTGKTVDHDQRQVLYWTDGLGAFEMQVIDPVVGKRTSVYKTITALNDKDHWTREQIADWLESIGL